MNTLFELNGIDVTPFTYRINNLQVADAEALGELGIDVKSLGETSLGVRTISWVGNITDESAYLKFRKAMFGSKKKVLKLSPDRQLNITGLKAENNLDLKDAARTGLTLTLFAADPLEYSAAESTAELTVDNQGDQITVTVRGEAPTIPQWEIEAKGQIINPSISDQNGNVLGWTGIIDTGDILLFGNDGSVTLNGEAVDNAGGSPLRLEPGSIIITFEDDVNSSHSCVLKATWRDAFY